MVRAARDEAGRRRLRNIQFHRSSAEHLPFPDNSFDAAVSRLAAMFFSDVSAALRDILRTLKPAGRISFVVWAAREINPFFSIVTDILNEFVPADVEEEDAPAAFRFAKPGKLASLLREAGAEVDERRLVFRIEAPINLEHFWELRTEMSDTFRRKIAKLSPVEVAAVKDAVQKAAARYFENDRMTFPAQALVVTGEKIKA
jgi:SAM-dependent methyltransferase